MNEIYIRVNFSKGNIEKTKEKLITGDYNSTKLVFEFDRNDGIKVFEMKNPDGQLVMTQTITNNEIVLVGKDENQNPASIFDRAGYYIFEISLYNGASKLTSCASEIQVKQEQVIIDGDVVTQYLPVFDELMQELSTKINEVDTLDVNADGETLTITKKDGTQKSVNIKGEKGDCYFATFEIINGRLIMNKPDELNQINFRLNSKGHLEMEVSV